MIDHPRRTSLRLRSYDYSSAGVYFVTIVTHRRAHLFGTVADGKMHLNDEGRSVEQAWNGIGKRFPSVEVDAYVVMPNHLHGLLRLSGSDLVGAPLVGARRAPTRPTQSQPPTLGDIIGAYKSVSTRAYIDGVRVNGWRPFPGRLWQRNYFEHIVRDEASLERIREYIHANPGMWETDPENRHASYGRLNRGPARSNLQERWMV